MNMALQSSKFVGTWDWDIPNDKVYADARFAQLYGVDIEHAAVGAPIVEFTKTIYPEDLPNVTAAIDKALADPSGYFGEEYRLIQSDGSVRWVDARGRCQRDASDKPIRFTGVAIDITERREAEETPPGKRRIQPQRDRKQPGLRQGSRSAGPARFQ